MTPRNPIQAELRHEFIGWPVDDRCIAFTNKHTWPAARETCNLPASDPIHLATNAREVSVAPTSDEPSTEIGGATAVGDPALTVPLTGSEAFAIYCHQVALKTWRKPHHQQALYLRLIEDQNVRDAFWAGRATLKPVLRDLLDSFAVAADTIDDGEEALIASHARTGLAWEAARAVLREPGKA